MAKKRTKPVKLTQTTITIELDELQAEVLEELTSRRNRDQQLEYDRAMAEYLVAEQRNAPVEKPADLIPLTVTDVARERLVASLEQETAIANRRVAESVSRALAKLSPRERAQMLDRLLAVEAPA